MNSNNYKKQCERALKRKLELIELKGGECEVCGYNNNIAALDFHHINPEDKNFQLDSRHLSNTHIDKLKQEVDKCILVCANCHREIHNPKFNKNNIGIVLEEFNTTKNIKVNSIKKKQKVCPECGKEFNSIKGKIYCSNECRLKAKHYPSLEEINIIYNELKSWNKVAEHFNLTRKIIQGIRKK